MYTGSPKHPIFSGATFGLMSGEKPLFQPQLHGGHEALGQALQRMGLRFDETQGKYKEPERSYIIYNPTVEQMKHLGKLFGQESVVHSENGQHKLIYTNGPDEGKYNPAQSQNPVEHFEQPPEDFYTAIPYHGYARINFDFNQTHPLEPVQPAATVGMAKKEYTPELAAFLAKNAIADLFRSQSRPHPHAYEWHDGHTEHHQEDFSVPGVPGLRKDESDLPQNPPQHPSNEQAAPAGSTPATYHKFALPYGHVSPGTKTDLLHYKYSGKLPDIEKLVKDHGYKAYYAGGKYGKPDLANKNYNTGHLMIYDPSPDSGASFGHEEYTRGWRQIHELAHALTYPELNKIYGEGRRIGKLGTHRTLNEALRSVHWEWLAAHKQRELSKQIGVHLSDADFNKELNTVMHDAVHRAITGKFTEPSEEGYQPHSHKIPLATALQMVRDSAHQMGLQGMHDTLNRKSEDLNKTDRFRDLKLLADREKRLKRSKDNSEKSALGHEIGKLRAIVKLLTTGEQPPANLMTPTTHKRPQKPLPVPRHQVEPPRTNDPAQHGVNPYTHPIPGATAYKRDIYGPQPSIPSQGMRPIKKTEPTAIYTKSGDTPVANEKLYTPEEVNTILMKATREKIAAFEKEIQILRDRELMKAEIKELRKAIIPSHKHNQALTTSQGIEDIPAAKLGKTGVPLSKPPVSQAQRAAMGAAASGHSTLGIPKSVGKEFIDADKGGKLPEHKKTKKADVAPTGGFGNGRDAGMAPGPTGPMAMNEDSPGAEVCKNCGKMSKMCKCMGKDEASPEGSKSFSHSSNEGSASVSVSPEPGGGEEVRIRAKTKKTELVDSKGKHSDSSEHPQSKLPDDKKSVETNKDKKGGSGGAVVPGKKPKDAGPVTKQSINDTQNNQGHATNLVENRPDKSHNNTAAVNRLMTTKHSSSGKAGDLITHAKKLPQTPPKAQLVQKSDRIHGQLPDKTEIKDPLNNPIYKAVTPPMAKPPSGQNMGTSVPTSAPKSPMAKAGPMGGMGKMPKDMQAQASHASHKAAMAAPGAGAPPAPMPSPAEHAERASAFQSAMSGAFQPPPAAAKPGGVKLPGAGLKPAAPAGLKAPPASMKPGSAGPVMNAARPQAPAKPGIFGRLMGKGELSPKGKKVKKIYEMGE